MKVKVVIGRVLTFGIAAEIGLLVASFALYSLKHGREPMEPPFNLAATIIQMPGILIANFLAQRLSLYHPAFYWIVTFATQFLIWSFLGGMFLAWRSTRATLKVVKGVEPEVR